MKNQSSIAALPQQINHRWGIILAGGSGRRLQQFIKKKLGEDRPKQYCALIGKRSMFRHTIDRVSNLFPKNHLLTTINAQHFSWAIKDLYDQSPETAIVQPYNRETGPGILLPLLHVHHADPKAIVALFPADHFILQEERYRSFVSIAIDFVSKHQGSIVMLGIVPNSLQYGYGWIEKGDQIFPEGISTVKNFWEKPDSRMLDYLFEKKCLWNTMTLIGTSENFLKLYKEHMNDVFAPSQRITDSLETTGSLDVTIDVFKTIPTVCFSNNILEKIPEQLCVLQMTGVYWNDWGDEVRIQTDIDFLEHQYQPKGGEEVRMKFQLQTNIYH